MLPMNKRDGRWNGLTTAHAKYWDLERRMKCYSGWRCATPSHHQLLHFELESAL